MIFSPQRWPWPRFCSRTPKKFVLSPILLKFPHPPKKIKYSKSIDNAILFPMVPTMLRTYVGKYFFWFIENRKKRMSFKGRVAIKALATTRYEYHRIISTLYQAVTLAVDPNEVNFDIRWLQLARYMQYSLFNIHRKLVRSGIRYWGCDIRYSSAHCSNNIP